METGTWCYFCQKVIGAEQKVKNLHKRGWAHLECAKENRRVLLINSFCFIFLFWMGPWGLPYPDPFPNKKGARKSFWRSKIDKTPVGICPFCEQKIEADQLTKEIPMTEGKSAHLKCCKNRVY